MASDTKVQGIFGIRESVSHVMWAVWSTGLYVCTCTDTVPLFRYCTFVQIQYLVQISYLCSDTVPLFRSFVLYLALQNVTNHMKAAVVFLNSYFQPVSGMCTLIVLCYYTVCVHYKLREVSVFGCCILNDLNMPGV